MSTHQHSKSEPITAERLAVAVYLLALGVLASSSALDSAYWARGSRSGPITPVPLGSGDGAMWRFSYEHVDPPFQTDERVDYFVNACTTGVAVLGSSSESDVDYWALTFRAVADSVAPDQYC